MKILVLGSSGVIGSSLIKKLLEVGHEVVEWDIEISETHDLRDPKNIIGLSTILKVCDFVYFLAFDVGGSKYLGNLGVDYINNNLQIMKNTFDCLEGVPFIFASSQMYNMENIYGTLKHLGEHYTRILGGLSVRLWNVYGNEKVSIKSHVITDMIDMYNTNGTIVLRTNGKEERQFLHSDDCADCLIVIMDNYETIKKTEVTIDVTNFEWISIESVAKMISDCVNVNTDVVDTVHTNKTEPRRFILDYWSPKISLKDGIYKLLNGSNN